MTQAEASRLLGMAREGQPIPEAVLTEALYMVGEADDCPALPHPDLLGFMVAMRESGLL